MRDGPCVPLNPWSPHFEKSLSPIGKFRNAPPQVQIISHTHAFLHCWSILYDMKCRQKTNPKGENIQVNTNFRIFFRHCDAPSCRTTEGTQTPKRLASPVGFLCGARSPELRDSQVGPSHYRVTATGDVLSWPPQKAFQSVRLSRARLYVLTRNVKICNFKKPVCASEC